MSNLIQTNTIKFVNWTLNFEVKANKDCSIISAIYLMKYNDYQKEYMREANNL